MLSHPKVRSTDGWKLHLNVPRDETNPTVRQLIELCLDDRLEYKVGHDSDQEGKGMTIHIGKRKDAEIVAKKIKGLESRGILPDLIPVSHRVLTDDLPFGDSTTKIYGRFDVGRRIGHQFDLHQYGMHGLPFRNIDMERLAFKNISTESSDEYQKKSWIRSYNILEKLLGEEFTGVPKGQTPEWAKWAFDVNNRDYPWEPQAKRTSSSHAWFEGRIKAVLIHAPRK